MRQSQLFTTTQKQVAAEEVSINAQLLLRAGYIDRLFAGVYSFLPLGLRVLTKIETIVREEMNKIDGQEILMPALNPKENWVTTGRWDGLDVLFKLPGAGDKEYALAATHEEVVTPLLKKFVFSYKNLPQSVYQLQTKFRNEARAKSGVLRGREFRMKDMYSFHTNQADLDAYYERVTEAYFRIYTRCGIRLQTYLTFASGGTFSKYSHEYQTVTDAGEDLIYICDHCQIAANKEIIADIDNACPQCKGTILREAKAIEVGNIFKLGTKYSAPFDFNFIDENNTSNPVIMGCYGMGPSRVLGTIVEVHHDANGIVWPSEVAPFAVHLVSLCQDAADIAAVNTLYEQLLEKKIEVLFDDRADVRAGEKFADSDLLGIPLRVVVSPKTLAANSVEIKKRSETTATVVPLNEFLASYV
jgi:prolyl-tRNA synthetase